MTLKKLDSASTVVVQVFKGYPCIESVRQKLTYDLHPKLSLGFVRSETANVPIGCAVQKVQASVEI